jgi:hypothetical protein
MMLSGRVRAAFEMPLLVDDRQFRATASIAACHALGATHLALDWHRIDEGSACVSVQTQMTR